MLWMCESLIDESCSNHSLVLVAAYCQVLGHLVGVVECFLDNFYDIARAAIDFESERGVIAHAWCDERGVIVDRLVLLSTVWDVSFHGGDL